MIQELVSGLPVTGPTRGLAGGARTVWGTEPPAVATLGPLAVTVLTTPATLGSTAATTVLTPSS